MALADSTRSTTASMGTVASDIEKLLVPYAFTNQAALINSGATSATAITSLSAAVTTVTGSIVRVNVNMNVGNGTVDNWITITLYRDASPLTNATMSAFIRKAATTGDEVCLSLEYVDAPTAGSHTYAVYWHTSGGTMYSSVRRISALVFRNT